MSGHKYVLNTTNLFEDDVDDNTFVNSYTSRQSVSQPTTTPYGGHLGELERQRQAMLQRQREIEQRTVDSSLRSLSILEDSEKIGIATGEELSRQGEQLRNTHNRLEEINTNLNRSQKHLNGIKSVFYGLKNYISGKTDQAPRSQTSPDSSSVKPSTSNLDQTLNNVSKIKDDHFSTHPSTRLRGLEPETASAPVTDSQRVNEILDANLDEMVKAITRLKGIGTALTEEIDQQNVLLDTITDKVETADIKIGKQNKQMNKLLGK